MQKHSNHYVAKSEIFNIKLFLLKRFLKTW